MNIYQKLIAVRKSVPYIQKADSGAQYNYTGSSRVLAAVRDKLDELGLLLIPAVTNHNLLLSEIEFKNESGNATKRTTTYFTELEMTMTWVNAENPEEKIECGWYAQGVDIAGEKGVGKALTYGEKYFMLKFFNIPTDKDDPDAFQAKHEPEEKMPITIKTKYKLGGYPEAKFDAWVANKRANGISYQEIENTLDEVISNKKESA